MDKLVKLVNQFYLPIKYPMIGEVGKYTGKFLIIKRHYWFLHGRSLRAHYFLKLTKFKRKIKK